MAVEAGELMAIIGNSGSGKSTLLNMLGGLDRPSAGSLWVDGRDLLKFTDKELVKYKRDTVGFIWQSNARNLIPYLTAQENVELPIMLKGRDRSARAAEMLDMVGLGHRRKSKLEQLSGGEQQRVAIAIALANEPKLLLADEPTGAVDTKTADQILDVFRDLSRNMGLTVIIVTHDQQVSRKVDRVVAIRDGRTSSEFIRRRSYIEELEAMEHEIDAIEEEHDTHEELAVLDRSGRLQIPREYLERIGMAGAKKVKVELEEDRIVLVNPIKDAAQKAVEVK